MTTLASLLLRPLVLDVLLHDGPTVAGAEAFLAALPVPAYKPEHKPTTGVLLRTWVGKGKPCSRCGGRMRKGATESAAQWMARERCRACVAARSRLSDPQGTTRNTSREHA